MIVHLIYFNLNSFYNAERYSQRLSDHRKSLRHQSEESKYEHTMINPTSLSQTHTEVFIVIFGSINNFINASYRFSLMVHMELHLFTYLKQSMRF